MRIGRTLISCFALALCATQLAWTCTPTSTDFTVPSVTLTGPSVLTVGQPPSTYQVTFPVSWADGSSGATGLPTVSLVEEPVFPVNSGGLFGWQNVVVMNPQSPYGVVFHLSCPGNSVVGEDGPSFPCDYSSGICGPNGPCSCFHEDGSTNDPDSHLGGTDWKGDPLAAQVHVEVAAYPGGPTVKSNTIFINCHQP